MFLKRLEHQGRQASLIASMMLHAWPMLPSEEVILTSLSGIAGLARFAFHNSPCIFSTLRVAT